MRIEREREEEVDRIKAEVQGLVKRRKRGEREPLDEVVITKKARIEEDGGEEAEVEEDQDEDEEEEEESESGSEEDWQKEAAAQLAAEAEEDETRREEEAKRVKEAEEAEAKRVQQPLSMPDRVDLSLDEAKALFKVFSPHQSIILTLTAAADAVAREGNQSLAPLGYLFAIFYFRPSIRTPPLCLSTP